MQFRGEVPIDPHIAAEIAAREFRQIQPIMQDGPEHLVGVAVVVFLIVFFGQIGQHIGLLTALIGPNLHVRPRGDPTAPAEPNPGMPLENRTDRHGQPAGAACAVAARNRNPVGNHN